MNLLKNKYLLLFIALALHPALSFAERADREKPILMEADRVTVNDQTQTSTFEGNVQLRQGTLLIEAVKIIVVQEKNGTSIMTATGQPAHLRQKRDNLNEYTDGFGERIVYDSVAETANLYGQARVKREGDDVSGEHIVYNTKTGVFQVFGSAANSPDTGKPGRVTIVIQPKEKSPKDKASEPAPTNQPLPPRPSPTLTPTLP